jgi:ethanolamine utilization protein EutQ (cupin superfamily)
MTKSVLVKKPALVKVPGKRIEEYIGLVSTKSRHVSVALMAAPKGWKEVGQTPEFEEITIVLDGCLKVEFEDKTINAKRGQAIIVPGNHWVRYSSPYSRGAKYISVCIPAFSIKTVHRDDPNG